MVIGRQGDNGVAGGSFAEGFTRAIAMIDAVGRITMVNAKTERMFGYSRVELLGQPIDMLTPDHSTPIVGNCGTPSSATSEHAWSAPV